VPLRAAGAGGWDAGGRILRLAQGGNGAWRVEADGMPLPLAWVAAQDGVHFMLGDGDHAATVAPSAAAGKRTADASQGRVTAPMNGRVAALPVAQGSAVKAGQVVAVIEAMKMEHSLLAPCDGVLDTVHVKVGDQAVPGQLLVWVVATRL
jgi:geranyl-CoA carboxylase alpha subunit